MWRRLLLFLALTVLALALVVVPGVVIIAGQTNWARSRVHEALARGLADYLKREVAVGPVSGSLLDGFTVDGLAIAEKRALRDGAVATAQQVRLEYDLWSVLRGRMAPAASISAVHVYGLRARIARDSGGRLNLTQLLPTLRPAPVTDRFRGKIVLHDAALLYEDHNRVLRAPLIARGQRIELIADCRQVTCIRLAGSGHILDGRAGDFTLASVISLDRPFFNLDLALQNVDLPWLARHFRGVAEAGLRSGRADVSGSLFTVSRRGKRRTGLSAALDLHDLRLALRKVPPLTLNGGLWLDQSGLQAHGLRVGVAGTTYDVSGSVGNLQAPVLDVTLSAGAARLGPLLQALPAAVKRRWAVPRGGVANLRAQVIGPAANPDVRLKLALQDAMTLKLADLGTVQADQLQLQAEAISVARQPCVEATVTARRIAAPGLKLAAGGTAAQPREIAVGPMQGFRAVVRFCGGKPVAQAVVRTPFVRYGDLRATAVSTEALLVNDVLRLQKFQAQALGAAITAEASLRTTDPRAGLRARGTVRGLDLARLHEVPEATDLPQGLGGIVNADFQALLDGKHIVGKATFDGQDVQAEGVSARTFAGTVGLSGDSPLSGVGRVTATGVVREEVALDRAEALVRFRDRQVEVLSGVAQAPEGQVWGRGDVDFAGRTLNLRVQSADLALGPLGERAGYKGLGGVGYASGEVTGSFDAPVFTGHVMAFVPRLDDIVLSALTAQVRYGDDRLALSDLMATRGNGIISGDLTLSHLRGQREDIALAGSLTGEGLDLADLARLAKLDQPLTGLGEFTARITGTVGQPEAAGQVRLANATYRDLVVSQAEAPVTFADKRVTVAHGHATVLDATAQVQGALTLGEHPELEAFLTVGEIRLEGLAPYLGVKLPMAGMASVERLWVRGPTDDLQGGAHLRAQKVTIGDEIIGDLDTTLSLSRGQVRLHETSFDIAHGRVIVSGAYNTATRPHTLSAQAQLLQTDVPDLLYLVLPVAGAVDKRPEAEAQQLRSTLRSLALRLRGAVDGTVNIEGPVDNAEAAVDLAGERLVLDGRGLPQLTARGRVSREAVQDLVLTARQGDALVNADGNIVFDGPLDLNVEGTGIAMAQLRPWMHLKTPFGGTLGFTIVAGGMTHEPDLTASVDVASPSFAGVQFDVLSVPVATVSEGEVDVDTLVVKRGDTEIVLDGRLPFSWHLEDKSGARPGLIPDGPITLGGRIENTPLAFFLPLLDEYRRGTAAPTPAPAAEDQFRWASLKVEGAVNSAVSLTGTVRNPTVRGFLKLDNGTVQPKQWARALTDLKADLQFSGHGGANLVQVASVAGRYDQTRGELTGRLGVQSFAMRDLWRNAMDLRLSLAADQQSLPGGTELKGLKGALTLRTEDGAQVLRPEGLQVKVGGGDAELTGEARLREFRLARLAQNQFGLQLKMAPGRLRYRPYLDATVQGGLQLVTPPGQDRARLSGNWQAADGVIGLVAPAAGLNTFAAFGSQIPAPGLDLTLGLGEDMQLRGSSVKATLQPDPAAIHITGTPQLPMLVGSITTGRGTTMLPTATLRLRSLVVHYLVDPLPGSRSDPQTLRVRGTIEGDAETTVTRPGNSPVRIQVKISGSLPDQVAVTTSSEPPLTEAQIYALLGGVPFAYLPGVGGGEAGLGQVISEQFLAALGQVFQLRVFEPIEEELQRLLGLELGITFAFNEPITLQVGKYVLRNLLVTYERPLMDTNERFDLRVSYELPHGLRITYHNDERDINQIEMGYSFTF